MSSPTSIYELTPEEIRKMAVIAIEAKEKAYCPYSNFRVGASILTSKPVHSSLYHSGSNVEIASTPVGTCAERCALAPIVAGLKRPEMPVVRAVAVSVDIWPPSSPCGMCRQFLREFCELDVKVYMFGRRPGKQYAGIEDEAKEEHVIMTIGQLLPMSFGPNDMDKRENKDGGQIG